MTQKTLTHLMILHVHKSMTAKIYLKAVAQKFISRTSESQNLGALFLNFY